MEKLGLIVLLISLLVGCKTRTSHVKKDATDSVSTNREVSYIDVRAVLTMGVNSNQKIDSSWLNAIRLTNFNGVISSAGNIIGQADQAEVLQSGQASKESNHQENTKDSVSAQEKIVTESTTEVKKRNTVADKETKGVAVPWYMWLIGLFGLVCLIYIVYNRIKKKLKPF